jgi:hypothetical protein
VARTAIKVGKAMLFMAEKGEQCFSMASWRSDLGRFSPSLDHSEVARQKNVKHGRGLARNF